MEAVSFSESSVSVYQTTQCNIPEDSHLHTRRRENLRSHIILVVHQSRHESYLDSAQSHLDTVHIFTPLFPKHSFTNSLPSKRRSPKWSFAWGFLTGTLHFFFSSVRTKWTNCKPIKSCTRETVTGQNMLLVELFLAEHVIIVSRVFVQCRRV
jgi:hypothetical protein